MTITKAIESLISGEISLDFKGHNFHQEILNKRLTKTLKKYQGFLDTLESEYSDNSLVRAYSNKGYITPDDFKNTAIDTFYDLRGFLFPKIFSDGRIIISIDGLFCSKCEIDPKEIHLNLISGKAELYSFEMIEPMVFTYKDAAETQVESVVDKGEWDYIPMPKCEVDDFNSIDEIIEVDSNLIFRNFFLTQDDEYFKQNSRGSINSIGGVKELADLYADENILYGQTGNMSVHIYQKNDDIVILRSDVSDIIDEIDEYDFSDLEIEQIYKYKDWDYKGSVSCEVWRYMASSRSNLEKLDLKTDHYDDEVEVKLTSGKYEMKHNYRITDLGLLVSTIKKV